MLRTAKFTWAVLCLCGLLQLGCGGSSLSAFSGIPQSMLSLLPTNTVILQIINNVKATDGTAYTVELDITIDGAPQTLTALPSISTKYALGYCPTEVRTIAERWLNSKGQVVGGRDYANVDANSFPAGTFNCSSTLIWQLSATAVNTEAL